MTNLTNLELTTMTANELREIAKEFQMVGAWKAKKQQMIDFLEVKKSEQIKEKEEQEQKELIDFINEVVEVELEKPVKPSKPNKPIKKNKQGQEIILFDNENNFVAEFKTQIAAVKYCENNRLSNGGWLIRSLKSNGEEKFYMPNNKRSKSQNSKYSGVGYFAMRKAELIKQEA